MTHEVLWPMYASQQRRSIYNENFHNPNFKPVIERSEPLPPSQDAMHSSLACRLPRDFHLTGAEIDPMHPVKDKMILMQPTLQVRIPLDPNGENPNYSQLYQNLLGQDIIAVTPSGLSVVNLHGGTKRVEIEQKEAFVPAQPTGQIEMHNIVDQYHFFQIPVMDVTFPTGEPCTVKLEMVVHSDVFASRFTRNMLLANGTPISKRREYVNPSFVVVPRSRFL